MLQLQALFAASLLGQPARGMPPETCLTAPALPTCSQQACWPDQLPLHANRDALPTYSRSPRSPRYTPIETPCVLTPALPAYSLPLSPQALWRSRRTWMWPWSWAWASPPSGEASSSGRTSWAQVGGCWGREAWAAGAGSVGCWGGPRGRRWEACAVQAMRCMQHERRWAAGTGSMWPAAQAMRCMQHGHPPVTHPAEWAPSAHGWGCCRATG